MILLKYGVYLRNDSFPDACLKKNPIYLPEECSLKVCSLRRGRADTDLGFCKKNLNVNI